MSAQAIILGDKTDKIMKKSNRDVKLAYIKQTIDFKEVDEIFDDIVDE